jgi:hypothetical protein
MSPARLLVVLICAFVALSGVNYLFYYERVRALDAQSREAVNNLVTNPLGTIVKSADIVDEKQHEHQNMVRREIALGLVAVVAVVGVVASLPRRP